MPDIENSDSDEDTTYETDSKNKKYTHKRSLDLKENTRNKKRRADISIDREVIEVNPNLFSFDTTERTDISVDKEDAKINPSPFSLNTTRKDDVYLALAEKIFVKCSNTKDKKRAWDKRFFCVYCSKPYPKIARHFKDSHKYESEVAKFNLLTNTKF